MLSRRTRLALTAGVAAAASAVLMTACAPSGATTSTPTSGVRATGGRVSIVASTDVYGDIAKAIAGDDAEVTSIIDDPAQDPHDYEATPRDELAVSKADIVVVNGDGYDAFMAPLLQSTDPHPVVVGADPALVSNDAASDFTVQRGPLPTALTSPGSETNFEAALRSLTAPPAPGDESTHRWFDLGGIADTVVPELRNALDALDPSHAADYDARAAAYTAQLQDILDSLAPDGVPAAPLPVVATETIADPLLKPVGLVDATPAGYVDAVANGTDVPPSALQQTINMLSGPTPAIALIYNPQEASPQTEIVRQAAEAAGVPVVEFQETLPAGMSYLDYMNDRVSALTDVLAPHLTALAVQ